MKTDLDRLMRERNLDAAVILGPDGTGEVNAAFNYFVGGRHIVGMVIQRVGQPPQLLHGSMERDDAAQTGLALINMNRWPRREIAAAFPNPFAARVELHRRILTDLGVCGRVGIYGVAECGATLALLKQLERVVPDLTWVAEGDSDAISTARQTKDDAELAAVAEVGRATATLVWEVRDWLAGHRAHDGRLMTPTGEALTIRDAKAFVRQRLGAHGLEHPGDFIFSQGADAAVPHNRGNPNEAIFTGRTIIFDIFPRRPGGYYHDVTRTWCLGHAPDEAYALWADVHAAFEAATAAHRVGASTHALQKATCDLFESRGHTTSRQDPASHDGYVHGLGHGLGLEVHEEPYFRTFEDSGSTLQPGMVFTVEPGLYYPARGLAARIEDTYACDGSGRFSSLTNLPCELLVPLR